MNEYVGICYLKCSLYLLSKWIAQERISFIAKDNSFYNMRIYFNKYTLNKGLRRGVT